MRPSKLARDIRLGIRSLILNGSRSLLTMLGMVFGVGSVVAMLSVGEGASSEALEQIRLLGSTNIIIRSVKPVEEVAGSQERVLMSIYGLTYEDERRLKETFASVTRTVPVKQLRKEGRSGERAMEVRAVGTTPEWFDLIRRPLLTGRRLIQNDLTKSANVAVLSEEVARTLIPMDNPLGHTIRIGGDYFRVVGVLGKTGGESTGLQTPDQADDVYIPINVARERFGDVSVQRMAGSRIRERVELHQLIAEVASVDEVEATAGGIEEMLRQFHPRADYRVSVPLALLRQAEATRRTFNIVLGSIAAISLLVGGIGIMNIMLATVTERTREIGIRRAIGAKRRQIIAQFLIETMVLSTTGGLIGLALGLAIPWIITRFSGLTTIVTPFSLILSLGISLAVGIVFGLYPAVRAARLDPIQALRHE